MLKHERTMKPPLVPSAPSWHVLLNKGDLIPEDLVSYFTDGEAEVQRVDPKAAYW